ncbi:hypothetical protein [Streptomyces coeruleorubidus]|uniref:hypothetical protein n=1 Tax=Streptomyces coeruleorubidus TaxID=116188 RepID=UPI0036811E52
MAGRPDRRLPDRDEVAAAVHDILTVPSGKRADLATAAPEPLGQIFAFSRTQAPIRAMAASASGARPAP